MAKESHRLGGVSGWSIRVVAAAKRQFSKATYTHVELWRDADAVAGTEAGLRVSCALTDDEASIGPLTRAEIIKVTGVSMEDAVFLRSLVHQGWRRRLRVMK